MLGMELHWSKEQVILTQTTMIESMAKKYLYLEDGANGRKASLPSESQHYQKPEQSEEVQNYQAIVGGLLFIGRMTRPEISIHINLLGRRTKDHDRNNYQTALKVLRHLYLTKFDGLHLKKADDLEIRIYADASYGGEESRSQSCVMITLGNQLVGWYSRRQEILSLSITEAEYIADCKGVKDAAWMQQFLAELGITTRPTLYTDSERSVQPEQGIEVCSKESPYRTLIPLPMPTSPIWKTEHNDYSRAKQPSRYPDEVVTYECDEWMEGIMDEYIANMFQDETPILEMTEHQLQQNGLSTWTLE